MNMFLIVIIAVAILFVVVNNKSNATDSKPSVLVLSASDMHGGYFDSEGQLKRYTPTPVQLLANYSGFNCCDETFNGLQLFEALIGGPIRFLAADPGQATVIKPLTELLDSYPQCRFVFTGLGMNDVLFGGVSIDQFLVHKEREIALIRKAGKIPVVRGFHNFAVTKNMPPEKIWLSEEADDALQAKCLALGVPYIDSKTVQFDGAADIQVDGLHPTAEYHDRLCAYQAAELKKIVAKY